MFPSLIGSGESGDNVKEASVELNGVMRFSGELGELALHCLESESLQRRNWIKQRVERMGDLMHSFGDANLPQGMHDAIYLYEITSALDLKNPNLSSGVLERRRNLVEEYLTQADLTNAESDYVFSILGDLSYMDDEANNYRSHPNMYENKIDQRFRKVIQDSYSQEITTSDWLVRGKSANFMRMQEVLTQVNLESVIIKALQLMDDLRKSQDHSEVELLHKINEAEYFYAPICEIIGFDGLATALRDKSLQIRFMKSGQDEALAKAWRIHEKVKGDDVSLVLGMLGENSPRYDFTVEQVAGKMSGEPDIVNVGDFVVDFPGASGNVFGSYRLKTVGSIADKIVRKPEYANTMPMDLIGMTFMLEDDADLELVMSHTFYQLEGRVEFRSTPNKASPFYIQASDQRVRRLGRLMSDFNGNVQAKVVGEEQFQVAKMTFVLKDRPDVSVEMQFLTQTDRRASRIGQEAHILYKLGNDLLDDELGRLTSFMVDINKRRNYMVNSTGEVTVQAESLQRAQRQHFI